MRKTSRHGVHDEELVSFSGRVTPEFLALVKITSDQCGCNGMDLMRMGVENVATGKRILVNGEISPDYIDAYNAQLEIIKTKRREHLKRKDQSK